MVFVQFEQISSAIFDAPDRNAATRLAVFARVPSHGDEQNARHQRNVTAPVSACPRRDARPPASGVSPIRQGGRTPCEAAPRSEPRAASRYDEPTPVREQNRRSGLSLTIRFTCPVKRARRSGPEPRRVRDHKAWRREPQELISQLRQHPALDQPVEMLLDPPGKSPPRASNPSSMLIENA